MRQMMAVAAVSGMVVSLVFCRPVCAAEKTNPAVTPSEAARRNIESLVKAGKKDDAIRSIADTVAAGKHGDIHEWAVLELYTIAEQNPEKIQEIVTVLEAREKPGVENVPLKKAIAEGYVRLKDWNKVARIYEGLQAANPQDHGYKVRLIDYYVLAGEAPKAIAMLEPIVQQSPNDQYFGDILINAYVAAGMKDKALAMYQQRVNAEPNSAGLRGRYAQTLEGFGLLREALVQWKKAAEIDPSNPFFGKKAKEVTEALNTKR